MIDIQKIRKSTKCLLCEKKAVKSINKMPFCSHCLDGQLIRIVAACCMATEEVEIKFKIIPNGIKKFEKENPNEEKIV